jgi:predicted DNA binding CopG/RHH family protein
MRQNIIEETDMKTEYDLSKFKSRKNPYAKRLKKQITIGLHSETIEYFKKLSKEINIPYQNIIDMYLLDCAHKHLKPHITWKNF